MNRPYSISSIAFGEDQTVQVTYYEPAVDLKDRGLARIHTLIVAPGSGYDDTISIMLGAISHLIATIDEAWSELAPGV